METVYAAIDNSFHLHDIQTTGRSSLTNEKAHHYFLNRFVCVGEFFDGWLTRPILALNFWLQVEQGNVMESAGGLNNYSQHTMPEIIDWLIDFGFNVPPTAKVIWRRDLGL